jgi:hypothetical protein
MEMKVVGDRLAHGDDKGRAETEGAHSPAVLDNARAKVDRIWVTI